MTYERSLKDSTLGNSQRSFTTHLLNMFDNYDHAIKAVRFAPVKAKIYELTTDRHAIAEMTQMDANGYVRLLFVDHSGNVYEESVQYPHVIPLCVLENVLDLKQKQQAVNLHRAYVTDKKPLLKIKPSSVSSHAKESKPDYIDVLSSMLLDPDLSRYEKPKPMVKTKTSRFAAYVR